MQGILVGSTLAGEFERWHSRRWRRPTSRGLGLNYSCTRGILGVYWGYARVGLKSRDDDVRDDEGRDNEGRDNEGMDEGRDDVGRDNEGRDDEGRDEDRLHFGGELFG